MPAEPGRLGALTKTRATAAADDARQQKGQNNCKELCICDACPSDALGE